MKHITEASPESDIATARSAVENYLAECHPRATETNYEIFSGLYERLGKLDMHLPADMARGFINAWLARRANP
jgi:hypothetical protein